MSHKFIDTRFFFPLILGSLVLSACAARINAPAGVTTAESTPQPVLRVTPSQAATATSAPSPTPTATPTPFKACSPLEGLSIPEMTQIVSNPFQAPLPGRDDGHHGTDFAYYSRGSRKTMLGLPIYSVLAGRIASVIDNRPPYGNMIIVETPLDQLPAGLLDGISFSPQTLPAPGDIRLMCPTPASPPQWDSSHQSLYLLYAHMVEHEPLTIGQAVACGDSLGGVGTTGASVNPHLHFEVRLGPAGASFPALSHYSTTATDAERSGYCTWRVSGVFRMADPIQFFSTVEKLP